MKKEVGDLTTQLELATTQLKKAQANAKSEQNLREAITTYASVIVHDQNTPLSVISMAHSFFKETLPKVVNVCLTAKMNKLKGTNRISHDQLDNLVSWNNMIGESHTKMQNIIDNSLHNIQTAIAIHNGKTVDNDLVECDLVNDNLSNSILEVLFLGVAPEIVHLDLQYKFKYLGNKILMDQVISTLIQNALSQIKQSGNGEIYITTEELPNNNILRIMDTADVVESAIVNHMFDSQSAIKPDGTCLAFCKTTMQRFGGDITVNSKDGEYMEFVLSFPKL